MKTDSSTIGTARVKVKPASYVTATVKDCPTDNDTQIQFGDRGLDLLLNVHRLFGISYLGASVPPKTFSIYMKLILIVWSVVACCVSYYNFYVSTYGISTEDLKSITTQTNIVQADASHSFVNQTLDEPFLSENNITPLVDYIRFSSMMVYFLFSYLLNLYLGFVVRPLLKIVHSEIHPMLEPSIEYQIGASIALVQFVSIFFLTVLFQVLLFLKFGSILYVRWIENILNLYSLSCPVAWIAYFNLTCSYIVKHKAKEGFSVVSVPLFVNRLILVRRVIEQFTHLLAPAILMLILNSAVVCISSLGLLIADFPNTFFISIIGTVDYSAMLVALCLTACLTAESSLSTSQYLKEQITISSGFYDGIITNNVNSRGVKKDHLYPTSVPSSDVLANLYNRSSAFKSVKDCNSGSTHCLQIIMLNSLPETVQMSPYGLFTLNRKFILTFFSFVLANSVILIQTSGSTPSPRK